MEYYIQIQTCSACTLYQLVIVLVQSFARVRIGGASQVRVVITSLGKRGSKLGSVVNFAVRTAQQATSLLVSPQGSVSVPQVHHVAHC